jgi:hypothetical protein
VKAPNDPNILVTGAPGSGKSFTAAMDALRFPGAVIIQDPHKGSLAQLVLTHAEGNVLFDRLSDVKNALGYELLKPSSDPDPPTRAQQNLLRAQAFIEILMRRRGGTMAGAPLMEEWITALLMLYLANARAPPLAILPFGFLPGTDEFEVLVSGCTLPEVRHKFRQLEKLKPPALRSELGSASRLVNAVFRSPSFLAPTRGGFDLGAFLQRRGMLIVERGDEIDDDAMRTIMCGITTLAIQHAKSRPVPYPPIRVYLDECTNAGTAGLQEEKACLETRKAGLTFCLLTQFLNFPGGVDGFLTGCVRKEVYRAGDYDLARKMATILAPGFPPGEEKRTELIARLTTEIMNLEPGWRFVTDRSGSRKEYVPMLEEPWPDWPGLREGKLKEKIEWIHQRPEYRRSSPPSATPVSPTILPDTSAPPARSPAPDSPVERLRRKGRKPPAGS